MVPLNDSDLMIDLIKKLDAEVVLVSQNYLGSINHTLMSAEILKNRGITINKLVISGTTDASSEMIISKLTKLEIIRIPHFKELKKEEIKKFASGFKL